MHICYFINHLSPGAPTLLLDIIENTADDNISYTVCHIEGDDDLVEDIKAAGAEVIDFEAEFKFDPRALYRMAQFFRKNDFDVLHAHLPYSQTLGRIFAFINDIDTVVSTQHTIPENYHPITRALEYKTRKLDDATIGVSEGVERAFRGQAHQFDGSLDNNWCTIYNGINVRDYNMAVKNADPESIDYAVDSETTVYLNIGRYVSAKAQLDLVDAMDLVVESVPDAHLFIVGWGKREETIRDRVNSLGLENNISVTGRVPSGRSGNVPSIYNYYALADIFVSSSVSEGLPLTHLEAMSAEVPIVSTAIPGVKEVIVDGETGLLVPPRSPQELADAMIELEDKAVRKEIAAAGFDRVSETFSIDTIVDQHLQLYQLLKENN